MRWHTSFGLVGWWHEIVWKRELWLQTQSKVGRGHLMRTCGGRSPCRYAAQAWQRQTQAGAVRPQEASWREWRASRDPGGGVGEYSDVISAGRNQDRPLQFLV